MPLLTASRRTGDEGRPPPGGPSASRLPPLLAIVVLLGVYAAVGGYYAVVGTLPGLDGAPRLTLTMPPRGGPEPARSALLKPPGAAGQPPAGDAAAPAPPAPPAPAAVPPIPQVSALPPPSLDALPTPPRADPLPPAPAAELLQKTHHAGDLPVVGRDGRQPWQVYARPFAGAAGQPRVAVLVTGLGLSRAATEAAIDKLPADVTLAFSPYARELDEWVRRARAAGHEVLLELPMEPRSFPARDPGPLGLLTSLPAATVMARLERIMGKAGGYVGLVAPGGSPFAAAPAAGRVLDELRRRGLLYVADAAPEAGRPAFVPIGQALDAQPFRDAIDARLAQLAGRARADGQALAVTDPLPVAIERLAMWLPGLAKAGVVLAPVSALAKPPTPS